MQKWNWDTLVCLSHENGRTTATENFEKGVLASLMGYENWSGAQLHFRRGIYNEMELSSTYSLYKCTTVMRTEIFANLHVFQQILHNKMQERDDVPTDF